SRAHASEHFWISNPKGAAHTQIQSALFRTRGKDAGQSFNRRLKACVFPLYLLLIGAVRLLPKDPGYLCGLGRAELIDRVKCYQGDGANFHDGHFAVGSFYGPLDGALRRWIARGLRDPQQSDVPYKVRLGLQLVKSLVDLRWILGCLFQGSSHFIW